MSGICRVFESRWLPRIRLCSTYTVRSTRTGSIGPGGKPTGLRSLIGGSDEEEELTTTLSSGRATRAAWCAIGEDAGHFWPGVANRSATCGRGGFVTHCHTSATRLRNAQRSSTSPCTRTSATSPAPISFLPLLHLVVASPDPILSKSRRAPCVPSAPSAVCAKPPVRRLCGEGAETRAVSRDCGHKANRNLTHAPACLGTKAGGSCFDKQLIPGSLLASIRRSLPPFTSLLSWPTDQAHEAGHWMTSSTLTPKT